MLSTLKDEGICLTEEEFVRNTVLEKIIPESGMKKTVENAFDLAQMASKLK
jgi:hypothetical protein